MGLINMHIVSWAAQECEWQQSGEMSVAWMIRGWLYARSRRNRKIWVHDILTLGGLVEPRCNNGLWYRDCSVRVGSSIKLDHGLVPPAMAQLVNGQHDLDPTEWFRQYEEIHPFRDGNGRTGSILFNWLSGSLVMPVFPPNLWKDARR